MSCQVLIPLSTVESDAMDPGSSYKVKAEVEEGLQQQDSQNRPLGQLNSKPAPNTSSALKRRSSSSHVVDGEPNPPSKKPRQASPPLDLDRAIVTILVGPREEVFRMDAGRLRDKSSFFVEEFLDNWNETVKVHLREIEPRRFKIYKEVYGRDISWEADMKLSTEAEAADGSDEFISKRVLADIGYDAGKSHYCDHLCRLWALGDFLGDTAFQKLVLERLNKITLVGSESRTPTAEDPIWASHFVMSFHLLNYIYHLEACDSAPLVRWAVCAVSTRFRMEEWLDAYGSTLPRGYMSDVYKMKLRDRGAHYKSKLAVLEKEFGDLRAKREQCMRTHCCRCLKGCGWAE